MTTDGRDIRDTYGLKQPQALARTAPHATQNHIATANASQKLTPRWDLPDEGLNAALESISDVSESKSQGQRTLRFLSGESASRITVMVIRIASMAVNFLVQIVMARMMGLAAFGTANTALAILWILVVPAALGYDTAAIRFVALARTDQPKLRALTVRFARATALGSLATSAVIAAGAVVENSTGNQGLAIGLALLIIITPCFAFVRVGEAWLRGFGSVVRAQINSNLLIPALTIVFLLTQRLFAGTIGVAGALGARAVATAVSVALVVGFILRRLGGHVNPRSDLEDSTKTEMHEVALVLCGVAFLTMAVFQIDIVAVSYLRGPAAAGVYSAASRVAMAMNVCIVAVTFVLAPHVARLFTEGRKAQLQHEVSSAAFWSASLMAGACAILIPASPLVLHIFGSDFGGGSNALRILMLGQLANGVCGPVATVLNMTGKQLLAIRALGVAAVVDLVLLGTLVPLLGITGAACATASCTLIWNVIMLVYVRRDLGIWALPQFVAKIMP